MKRLSAYGALLIVCLMLAGAINVEDALSAESANESATAFIGQPVPLGQPAPEDAGPTACRVIEFDHAELIGGFINDTYLLTVSGVKSHINMDVELWPYIYIKQPEYWKIEVVGCMGEIGLPTTEPYVVDLWVTNFMGTAGVEVVGAKRTKKLPKPK